MDQWIGIREIIESALELDPSERPRFIAEACAGDAALLREVQEYLRYEPSAGLDLSVEAWLRDQPDPSADEPDPERIGAWRIIRRLGEGGMAVVYLAERDDGEFRQRVALKALRAGPRSAQSLRLFQRERQILAQLQHPGIARLMDGGSADGRVFFVMEYVEGKPVTEYCNQRQLTLRQRLALFCRICDAVSYAHRKLIAHRDLKPANILVTEDGQPRLLDFGLAKVLQDPGNGGAETASTVGPMLTPAYASPEQVRGQPLSASTDVYSLGVLLYELLTGRNPQVRGEESPMEVYRTILDEEPPAPSHAVERGQRRPLKGDLDDILLMALRKEPEHRYRSVHEFREDIERYLGGFPVRASQGTVWYRLRKYSRRHRWGIAVSALSAVTALSGAGIIWWEGRMAEMRFEQVRGLAHSVIFELHDSISSLKGSTAARKLIVRRALEYLGNLQAGGAKKRELQLEIAAAYRKLGQVQGAWTTGRSGGHLGDMAGAARSYEQARQILSDNLNAGSQDRASLQALAEVDEDLSRVLWVFGDNARASALWREAAANWEKLARWNPPAPDAGARVLWNVAEGHYLAHEWSAAAPAFRQALFAYQRLAAQDPANDIWPEQITRSYRMLCYVERQPGDWNSALDAAREALRLDGNRARAAPEDRDAQMDLSWDWDNVGGILKHQGDLNASARAYAQAVAIAQRVSAADPQDANAAIYIANWLADSAEVYEQMGRRSKSLVAYRQAIDIFDEEFRHDPENTQIRGLYAVFLTEFADLEARTNTRAGWQTAAEMYQHAEELFKPLGPTLNLYAEDMATKADLPRRLALCRSHLMNAGRVH